MNRRVALLVGLGLAIPGTWLLSRANPDTPDEPRSSSAFELNHVAEGSVVLDLRGGSLQDETPSAPPKARTQSGTIEGRVVDADGTPVEGAVVVGGDTLTALGELLQGGDGTRTDAGGRFALTTYDTEDVVLIAAHEEQGMSRALQTTAGAEAQLELQPFTWIEGFVREGEQASDARVFVQDPGRSVSFIGRTDPSGYFMLGPIPPGEYVIRASAAGPRSEVVAYPVSTVALEPGTTTTHDVIESDAGAVRVDYRRTPNMRVATVGVALFEGTHRIDSDAAYQALVRDSAPGSVHTSSTIGAQQESTLFRGVGTGRHTACVRANLGAQGMQVRCEEVVVDQTKTAEVDLRQYAG